MGLFQSRAATELAKLREQRAKLEAKGEGIREEIRKLASVSADERLDAFLAGAELGKNRERLLALEGELEDLRGAKRALIGRLRTAMLAVAHEKAEKKRAEAKKLQGELDLHQARTEELLAHLNEHDGVEYGPKGARGLMPVPGQLLPVPLRVQSRSAEMAVQIAGFIAEADRIEAEARQEAEGGRVANAESLDALLTGAAEHPLAPGEPEIREWFSQAVAQSDAAWARDQAHWTPAVDRVTRLTLVWNGDSTIDAAQSTAVNSHVSRPASIAEMPAYDPAWRDRQVQQPPRGWYPAA